MIRPPPISTLFPYTTLSRLKIFLTATPEERALRRHKQLKDKGSDVSLPALSREIAERDSRDQTRQIARVPLGYLDRKSTRLNSSHSQISYAVFCLKKKTDPA